MDADIIEGEYKQLETKDDWGDALDRDIDDTRIKEGDDGL